MITPTDQPNDYKFEGFKSASLNNASLDMFKQSIDTINQERETLIKKQAKAKNDNLEIDKSMENANLEITRLETKTNSGERQGLISTKENEIETLENEKSDIDKKHKPNWVNVTLYGLIFIPLSIYLFLFYTSIAHNGFYGIDINSLINGDKLAIGILPNFQDLIIAIQTNYILVVFPIVFFAFGTVLHIFLENEGKTKYFTISAVFLITLLLDAFIAFKIHNEIEKALGLIYDGEELLRFTDVWYKDINFYIILLMGFVVFIMWSIILHSILKEIDKQSLIKRINKIIQRRKKELDELKSRLNWLEGEIKRLISNKEINNKIIEKEVDKTIVEKINSFYNGWVGYINSAKNHCKDENTIKLFNEKEKDCALYLQGLNLNGK